MSKDPAENTRWGNPKKEGARELSSFEKYFGPVEQQSGSEQLFRGIVGKVLLSPGRLLTGNDKKTGRAEGMESTKRAFTYVLFSVTHFFIT